MTLSTGNHDERIKGVFSTQMVTKIGTGVTSRRTVTQSFFYVEENEQGEISIQPLNSSHVPTGSKEVIDREQLLKDYAPEPELYQKTVYPKLMELQKTLARADRHRARGETFSAEMEYSGALKIDEENVRANFGIGMCYMARGESAKAENILKRLVTLDGAFDAEHKHMFNEFGISLRKSKMFPQAMDYYSRALAISPQDANLQFNLARAALEAGDLPKAKEAIEACLALEPGFAEAVKFKEYLVKKGV